MEGYRMEERVDGICFGCGEYWVDCTCEESELE